ncbi:MAG: hypothetical protein IJ794_05210 [Lachnospiraceae bacterium]|nr:hypothetical protein [Lachnospiraceae bacterium]
MFQILWEEPIITAVILGLFGISLFIRILLGSLYRGMIRQSDNMATTNNRLLKQCKLKFSNCYQLNNGVSNIPVFVDKFLNRLTLGPFSFETLYHLSGQSMLLSVIFSGIGVCRAILRGKMMVEVLPYYIVSFIGLYLFFAVSTMVDLKGKRRVLAVNLVDYLENHLSARIGVTERDMNMLYGRKRALEVMPIGARSAVAAGAELQEFPRITELSRTQEVSAGTGRQRKASGSEIQQPKNQQPKIAQSETQQPDGTQLSKLDLAQPEITQVEAAESIKSVPPQSPRPDQASPFYISEEELEALIKEFC